MPYVIVTYDRGSVNNRVKTVTIICTLIIFEFDDFYPFAVFAFFMVSTWRDANIWFKRTRIEIVTHQVYPLYNKILVYSHSTIFSVCGELLGDYHFVHAVTANYIDCLCGSAAITAFGANVFAGAAGLFSSVPAFGKRAENIQQGNTLDHLQVLPALRFNEV